MRFLIAGDAEVQFYLDLTEIKYVVVRKPGINDGNAGEADKFAVDFYGDIRSSLLTLYYANQDQVDLTVAQWKMAKEKHV